MIRWLRNIFWPVQDVGLLDLLLLQKSITSPKGDGRNGAVSQRGQDVLRHTVGDNRRVRSCRRACHKLPKQLDAYGVTFEELYNEPSTDTQAVVGDDQRIVTN